MFWNRKGKKKGAGSGGADAAATAVDDPKTDDRAEGASAADSEGGTADAADAKAAAGAKEKGADAKAADGAADTGAKGADAAEEKDGAEEEPADDAKATAADAKDAEVDDAEDAKAEDADADDDADEDAEAADADGAEEEDGSDADSDSDADADSEEAPAERAGPVEPGTTKADSEGVQCVRTAGVLKFEDEEYETVSNTWIIEADKDGVIVIDPAHDAEAVLEAVGDREVLLIACTNGYNTHIQAAVEIAAETEAPIALHRRELRAWRKIHGVEHNPDMEIEGGGSLTVGDLEVDILATPGTSVGSVSYYISEKGVVCSGDILLAGQMGTVGGEHIDYTTQLASIGEVLLSLPPETRILPDSEVETTVGAEAKNFDQWLSMG